MWIIRLSSNEEKLSFSEGEEDLDHPGFEVFTAGETLDRMQLQHTRPVQCVSLPPQGLSRRP